MANPEHVEILKQGVEVWYEWRKKHYEISVPRLHKAQLNGAYLRDVDLGSADLSDADLSGSVLNGAYLRLADLSGADLRLADLRLANLNTAQLRGANLSTADLRLANLSSANLSDTNLSDANLRGANLRLADLSTADLSGADLSEANLSGVNLSGADLSGADLSHANLIETFFKPLTMKGVDFTASVMGHTTFADIDLREAKGLATITHLYPSTIGIDTLYKSAGKIPELFLRSCGVPDDFITFIPSHFGIQQAINFYSCFISYSHKDEEFAKRLFSQMRDSGLRVWYAPEEMKGGQKLHEQIFDAIHVHDKLLLVLSEHSLKSEWVMTEIRRARKAEREENRRKLFPIKLVDFDAIQQWECFDADSGKDLAVEMREYFIPDFSNWKDHDSFEKAFDRLLRDLKAEEDKASRPDAASSELYDRAILSPRNTFKEDWEQVTSSIVKIAKRNGLINDENIEVSQVVNKLFETGIISEAIKEKFYGLKKWHFNVVVFAGSSSEEPQSAINFVQMARELQKAIETACANNRIVENRKTGRPPKAKAESSKASQKSSKK